MGSNQNRFGDKHLPDEWGSKNRKQEAKEKKHAADNFAIEDSLASNEDDTQYDDECEYHCPLMDGADWCKCMEPPKPRAKRKRKDGKRWCRGKEGREHDPQPLETRGWLGRMFTIYVCSQCGRRDYRRR